MLQQLAAEAGRGRAEQSQVVPEVATEIQQDPRVGISLEKGLVKRMAATVDESPPPPPPPPPPPATAEGPPPAAQLLPADVRRAVSAADSPAVGVLARM